MGLAVRFNVRTLMYILLVVMVLLILDLCFMLSIGGRNKNKFVETKIDMDEVWYQFDQQNLRPIQTGRGPAKCQRILLTGNRDHICVATEPESEPDSGPNRGNFGGGIKVGGTVAVPIDRYTGNKGSQETNASNVDKTAPLFARKTKLSQKVQNALDRSSALASPNVTCTANRSRNRMINLYGQKFNISIPPFLTEGFESEPHILDLPFPFGVQKSATLVKETLDVVGNTSLPLVSKSKPCTRCVIVGNGGVIKDTAVGQVIDNFDVVIRINDAPTKGFEKDVGTKTTMRMCYPESAFTKSEQFSGDWLLLLMVFKPLDLTWLQTVSQGKKMESNKGFWKKIATSVPKKPEDFRILNPSILREAGFDIIGLPVSEGKLGKNVPTSGCVAIMLALRFCDEVAVAGFGYDTSRPNSPLHYYDKLKMSEIKRSWTHSVDKEQRMLYQLVDQGVIQDLTGGLLRS
ncbi:CMP-N-acetylneuraminate-beta-1,4-galactoside alpha-2,3-sialyltransferase-like isoform X1 [Asterias rubens]|uniref:CMP-N-acetylneuraminate-beta-1,4-galactoside alpha-2,3-sialyltransferase-like isoform X1 n=1 Tax=Asterias rubens TaxID=7604 RepID=UPI0014559AF7|nr:CMP-N-acetylneuraminate-beta-1,4-galactoside alpha-2,3-sialyltransferase-like isoform X1 [Asterias rubens]XP_033625852.1 CMP-N-acetylneuraminate-beta-1,4-galactoside alpha-2,3-sialyltransferase-like isoform X1 [Asterias rubens]XP_033625853.1 CMP-N-acetylneuraminate-beta-1,4-galactoside alpha-2,3-sialyltransferase-like isoform X1 [Asterias rubens]XP_033625854.1 CMP-N-acetylneuraminate-beta-1,4-galactoside alpha-2,3-sialyltransferase-like isoform X1 [Asterias rubens]